MDRRDFLKGSGAVLAGGMLADLGLFEAAASAAAKPNRRPNIVFILCDEMRFPTVFPGGINSPEQFLRRFMPNVHELWRHGVRFENYFSAGNACSPARAALATGLYPHQQWLMATRTPAGPSLQQDFPTYGRLLKGFGYQTPYIGKWHLSDPPSDGSTDGYLANYGFTGLTNPDPLGQNGEGLAKDPAIADQAVSWLQGNTSDKPYCLTVSFVNPHDKQFFWAGSEGDNFEQLFQNSGYQPYMSTYASQPPEDAPPSLRYPTVPPNWESRADLEKHNKPRTQEIFRGFQEFVWGGAPDDPKKTGYSVEQSPIAPKGWGTGVGPYDYWKRGLDMYTQVLNMVDQQIGRVVAAVPKQQLGNTVFVFASDHGEYAGAHGLLSGKIGTGYDEAFRVPLIVADPSRRYVKKANTSRKQLASSVDLAPMLVTLGNRGSSSWRRGRWAEIYDERLDLVELLRDPEAKGRGHVLFASDEILPNALNPGRAPWHILGVRTHSHKLVTYSHWEKGTTRAIRRGMEVEFYDYSTAKGRAELLSEPDDPRVKALVERLFKRYVPTQTQQPLPRGLRPAQRRARAGYLAFELASNAYTVSKLLGGDGEEPALRSDLGYGGAF